MTPRHGPQFALLLLLCAAVPLEATFAFNYFTSDTKLNWANARQYCQERGVSLATEQMVSFIDMGRRLEQMRTDSPVWVGLHRDPEDDESWRWINPSSADGGFTEADVSQSSNWTAGDQEPHCATVKNGKWRSELCSNFQDFYCSSENVSIFVNLEYSWDEAEEYCRNHSMTLLTANSENSAGLNQRGWIGLKKENNDTWKWSDNSPFDYTNWDDDEPRSWDCGSFDRDTMQWSSHECSERLKPLCLKDNLLVVRLNKTWEEALDHCSQLGTRTELLAIGREDVAKFVGKRLSLEDNTTKELWIALRYMQGSWWLPNGRDVEQSSLEECPAQERCGVLSKDEETWLHRDCAERRHFVCAD